MMAGQQQQQDISQRLAQNVLMAARDVEQGLDQEIKALDNMDEDDMEILRAKRMAQMKAQAAKKQELMAKGHGKYQEVNDEKEFFNMTKSSEKVVVHFYRRSNLHCQIVDKHMLKLAPKHIETRFLKVDAEKSPFLTERLSIWMLPTILAIKSNKVVEKIEGFDTLGGSDDFPTELLEWKLGQAEALKYTGTYDPEFELKERRKLKATASRGLRTGREGYGSDDSDDDYA